MRKLIIGGLVAVAAALGIALAPAGPAHADFLWWDCDSHAGVVVGTPTSCPFARNVAYRYLHGIPEIDVFSPVTGGYYDMDCEAGYTAQLASGGTRLAALCQGGNDANVIVF